MTRVLALTIPERETINWALDDASPGLGQVKVQIPSRPTGSAGSSRLSQTDHMSMLLRRWRHKRSPAARRGRDAAREYTARVANQQALTQGRHGTAAPEKR